MKNENESLETPDVSRRTFLKGMGVSVGAVALASAASGLVGCSPENNSSSNANANQSNEGSTDNSEQTEFDTIENARNKAADSTESKSADIVVIGSGIAGMSAAVEASNAGASVIVLEKSSITGGDSSICSGNFYCCGSKTQDDLGYTDYGTPQEIADFFYAQSDEDANREICELVANEGGEAMDWLVSLGCEFDKKPEGNASDRSMLSTTGGKGIVDTLIENAEANGVELMMETRAVQILMNGGSVSGVIARQGRTEYEITAKAIVLASGGFDGQDWSKELYAPGAVGWHTFSSPDNTGDGIELAREAGAQILLKGGLSQIHLVGRDPLPLNDELSVLRMVNSGVFVSDLGYRCANESMTSQFDYFTPFVQSGRDSFTIICDSKQSDERMELIQKGVTAKVVDTADTIEELAVKTDLPPYILAKTIEKYNKLCEQGEDTDFGKNPEDLVKLDQAPFYAIQITPNTNDSFGAVPINTKAEALDDDRNPVPGLYAAGTIANPELFYMRYAVSGSSLCMGTVTGRKAAQNAIEYYGG